MGEVFEARRTGPGGFRRAVALKRLIGDDAVRGISVQRLLAEARILASLHHPNVLEIHDVVAADAGYVLVMELLTGATLDALVREAAASGGLPVGELCAIADQALAGLDYIHAACSEDGRPLGLIHRDVTPNNVFVTELGEVKLIDFGIAKLRAAGDAPVTREGEIAGTLELIAPEQARGLPSDPRTDLYQLAATLYWALSGRYPHGTGTALELMARAASTQPPRLAALRSDLPEALTSAIDRAMAIESADRFADAAALRAALLPHVPIDGEARLAARVRAMPDSDDDPALSGARPAEPPRPDGPEAVSSHAPATVADRPGARRGEARGDVRGEVRGDVRAAPGRRWWRWWSLAAIAAGVAAGAALWLARGAPPVPVDQPADGPLKLDPIGDVPSPQGAALAAVPLPGDRLAFATRNEVHIVSLRGEELHAIKLPVSVVAFDLTALADGSMAVAGRDATGDRKLYFLSGDAERPRWSAVAGDVIALHPDGAVAAVARHGWSTSLQSVGSLSSVARTILPIVTERELVVALAWSSDGKRLAAVIDRGLDPPSIAIAALSPDAATSTRTELSHARFEGDVGMLAWLDADHLIYAVNQPDGAVLYRLSLRSQTEQRVMQWPDQRILGGRVAERVVALIHGPVRRQLWLGTPQEVKPLLAAGATSIAGFDRRGGIVFGRAAAAPIVRAADGTQAAWPGGSPGDRPQTLVDGTLLAVRNDALYRLDRSPQQLPAVVAPRGLTTVRCAEDAGPPCVAVHWAEATPRYRTIDAAGTGGAERPITNASYPFDHAVSRDGKKLAVVDGTSAIGIAGVARGDADGYRFTTVLDGAVLDGVAWAGDELIVSARGWNGKPWALLAVAPSRSSHAVGADPPAPVPPVESPPRVLAEAEDCVAAQVRATGSAVAALTTHVTPTLSVFRIR